ncbi:CinA family nicotinamide mononucleotide deamidase-related protein [Aliivibrio fischeri]|uniref:CinA family nicotinamide mononucleotide deamidase-related protein n=1 Tax=Aliivibrio fischeri TaxID=668 RepID=UPI00107EAE92|nr:CinA family nicotinamide mononucleotide deamidase-related protein [Aliivibrio fischeri]TGA72179.1 CinA family nicotinamide mononucleotide deamidase-related protein [Aliivibrio fischeri]
MLQVAMISTGEEVLHGDIVDTNAAWMSQLFYQHGFKLSNRSTVGDNIDALVSEIHHQTNQASIVIVNGGLGPTSDDISSEAAAKVLNTNLVMSQYWLDRMQARYLEQGKEMPHSNIKQAMLPEGAQLIDNPVGTACGFFIEINKSIVIFTPGVPSEFKVMVEHQILPRMKQWHPMVEASECSRLFTFGLSESGIQDKLQQVRLPHGFEIGYRSALPFIEVKLFGPKNHDGRFPTLEKMYHLLGDNVVSVDESMLPNVGALLNEFSLNFTVAEQATGGWLTNWLQEDEQIRSHMKQGWILSSQVDQQMAGQDPLAAALALAAATRERTQTSIGLSSGPMLEGKVAVALSTSYGEWGQLVSLKRDYSYNEMRSIISTLMLDMLRRCLERKAMFGEYQSLNRESEIYVPQSAL